LIRTLVTTTNAQPGYPILLILHNPLQRINSLLLAQDLLLKLIQTLQDHPHVNTDLIDVLSMMVNTPSGVFDLSFVICKRLLFGNDIGPELRFQLIAL